MSDNLKNVIQIMFFVLIFGSGFFAYQSGMADRFLSTKNVVVEEQKIGTTTERATEVPVTTEIAASPVELIISTTTETVISAVPTKDTVEVTTSPKIAEIKSDAQVDESAVINSVKAINSAILKYEKASFEKTGELPSYQFKVKVGAQWGTTVPVNATLDTLGIRDLIVKHVTAYPTLLLELNAPMPSMGFALLTKLPDGQQYCIDHNNFSGKGAFDIFDGWCKQ